MRAHDLWQNVLLASSCALLGLYFLIYFYIHQDLSFAPSAFVIFIKASPILLFVPFVLRKKKTISLGFSIMLFVYFGLAAINIFKAGNEAYAAMLECSILVVLFWSSFKLGKQEQALNKS